MLLKIYRSALSLASNRTIESLDDEGVALDACNENWPPIFDQILSYARWDFATKRVILRPRIIQGGAVPPGSAAEQLISLPERFREIPYRWIIGLAYQDEIGREQTRELIAAAGPDQEYIGPGGRLNAPIVFDPVELAILATLATPVRVTPLQQDRRIELVWARVPGATDYNVRWRQGAAGDWATIIGTDGFTERDFDQLENGALYQFQVMAKNTAGISRWSGAANGIPVGAPSEEQLAPPTPVGLVGFALNQSARMTWREVATATGYLLRLRLAGEWPDPFTSPNGDRGEATITGLANSNQYEVQVRAFNLYGRSDWSDSAFVTPMAQVPEVPRGLRVEALNGRLQLSWLRVAGATDYDVRHRLSTDTVWTPIEDTSITHPAVAEGDPNYRVAIIIPRLQNGMEYQLAVRASNANGPSLYSGHVTGTPQASRTPTITGLSPEPGDAEVALTHDAVQGATDYHYQYRKAIPNQDWIEVAQGGTATTHTITRLDNGVRYEFQARAVKPEAEGGVGLWSSSATATPEAALEPPGATSLRCVAGDSQAELIWTSAERADFYQFRQATTIGEWGDWMYAGAAGSTRRPITMLQNGTPYYFQVRGVNDASVPFGPESNTCDAEPAPVGEAPNVPERIRCQGQQSAVSITWDGDDRAADYAGEYQLLDDASQPVGVPTPFLSGDEDTAESTRVTGLSNDRTYQLRLKAINMFGESNWSDWVNCTPMPGIPSASQMQDPVCGNATVGLSWDSVADIATYQVYRSTNPGSPPTGDARAGDSRFDDLASTQYTDNSAQNGTLYYYFVRGVNSSGEGPWSNRVSCTPVAPLTVPPLPDNFGVVNGNANAVATWDDVAGETGYQIAYNTTGTRPLNVEEPVGVIIITAAADATTRTIENLANDSTYYFWLRSANMDVFSDWSDAESATPEAPPPPPGRPTLRLDECGNAQIQLDWNNVRGADSYQLYRSTSSSTPGSDPSGLIVRVSSSYTDTRVENGTTYYYWVRARGAGGNSEWSNRVSCRPEAPPPPPVPSLAVDVCGNVRIELDWNDVTGADSYQLYRSTSSSTPGSDPLSGLIAVSASRYTDTSVANGTTYYYWVRTRGLGGDSGWSNRVSCRPIAPTAPPTPTTTRVVMIPSATTAKRFRVTWSASSSATGYDLETQFRVRSSGNISSPWSREESNIPGTSDEETTGTSEIHDVQARVRAKNSVGDSGWRESAWVSVVHIPLTPPTPTTTRVVMIPSATTAKRFRVTWSASSSATGYDLETQFRVRSSGNISSSWSREENNIPGTSDEETTGASEANDVQARVRAKNSFGDSGWRESAWVPVVHIPA